MTPLLIYRDRLLPISETFIQAQAAALKRFRPQFAGLRRVTPSLPFNEDPIVVTTERTLASHVLAAAYTATGVAPAFTRRAQAVGAKLIHAHFAPDGAHAVRLAERLGLPLIVTLHGYDVTVRCEFANKYAKLWERASLFICVSEFIKRKALEAGFPDAKLRVHHIGIDCSKFLPGNGKRDENRVLFIGRLTEKKGLPFLLNAMRDVQSKRPRTVLQVIGDGPDRKDLEAMAAQQRINCEFVGSKSAEAVRASLGGCAVLCAPSVTAQNGDSEGLPTVVLEAQAMGIPVVSTYHAGIPEAVLPEKTGLLVPEHDVAKMSEALLRYLCDREFAQASGARGAEWVRDRFDLTRQTQALESIYDQVVSDFAFNQLKNIGRIMNILVTGGAGYIGSHAAKCLALAGHSPVVYDNLSRGNKWAVRWGPFVHGELDDKEKLFHTLKHYGIDAVLHFAASAYVGESMREPGSYFQNNSVNSLNLLEVMKAARVNRIVFSSTCAIYGDPEAIPIAEDHPRVPVSPYGESKLFVEKLLHWFGKLHGLQWVALRYFNASGADPEGEIGECHCPETHLIPLVLEAALDQASPISIFGVDYPTPDGTAVRDYIHVSDLASAHLKALDYLVANRKSRAFNLGTGRGHSIREVIDATFSMTGRRPAVIEAKRREGDPALLIADAQLANRELGWHPRQSSLPSIVSSAWSWRMANESRMLARAVAG